MKKEFHITVETTNSIVNLLAKESQLSKQVIKQTMQKGAVWLENSHGIHRIRRADKVVQAQDIIHCYYDETILAQTPNAPILVADEKDYSVWNKPGGMLSQGSKWGDHCTIHRWIEQNHTFEDGSQRQCFTVHRLDKATRGLILVAHKKTTANKLAELFEKRQIDKHYYALVAGKLPIKFNQHLDKEPTAKPILIESKIEGKLAKTYINRLDYNTDKNQCLLDIKIETGRKHQIRIHLSQYGYPIIGDRLYSENHEKDLQLQCYKINFKSPIDKTNKHYILPCQLIT